MKPSRFSAPTATTPEQLAGRVTAPCSLPAAATTTTPAPCAASSLMASWYAALQPPLPPKLMFTTRTGFGLRGTKPPDPLATSNPAAQRMPSTMSTTSAPHLPATRTGTTRPFQLMPAPPTVLLVAAASRPAMSVPCHELFSTAQSANSVGWAALSAALTKSPGSLGSGSRPSPSPENSTALTKS